MVLLLSIGIPFIWIASAIYNFVVMTKRYDHDVTIDHGRDGVWPTWLLFACPLLGPVMSISIWIFEVIDSQETRHQKKKENLQRELALLEKERAKALKDLEKEL